MGLYIGLGAAFLVCVAGIVFCIFKMKKTKRNLQQIEADIPVILENDKKIKEQLQSRGFVTNYSASSFGYRFWEYQTKHKAPNNLNLLLDNEHCEIVCYMLLPYDFKVYSFKNLLKYELNVNNGQVETTSNSLATGTSIAGIGIGSASTSGTSKQKVNSIIVQLYFDNGDLFGINFLNNASCYQGDEKYCCAITEAQRLSAQLDKILIINKQ